MNPKKLAKIAFDEEQSLETRAQAASDLQERLDALADELWDLAVGEPKPEPEEDDPYAELEANVENFRDAFERGAALLTDTYTGFIDTAKEFLAQLYPPEQHRDLH